MMTAAKSAIIQGTLARNLDLDELKQSGFESFQCGTQRSKQSKERTSTVFERSREAGFGFTSYL